MSRGLTGGCAARCRVLRNWRGQGLWNRSQRGEHGFRVREAGVNLVCKIDLETGEDDLIAGLIGDELALSVREHGIDLEEQFADLAGVVFHLRAGRHAARADRRQDASFDVAIAERGLPVVVLRQSPGARVEFDAEVKARLRIAEVGRLAVPHIQRRFKGFERG